MGSYLQYLSKRRIDDKNYVVKNVFQALENNRGEILHNGLCAYEVRFKNQKMFYIITKSRCCFMTHFLALSRLCDTVQQRYDLYRLRKVTKRKQNKRKRKGEMKNV